MIPAATVPQVSLSPCWVAGTGFRPIDDTGAACALIDTPMEGKMPIYYGTDDIHPLRSLFLGWGAAEASGGMTHVVVDAPAPAPVPLPTAGEMLAVALVTTAIAAALLKFTTVDEAVRGPDSGRP